MLSININIIYKSKITMNKILTHADSISAVVTFIEPPFPNAKKFVPKARNILPASFYQAFLSKAAKERLPSPSESFISDDLWPSLKIFGVRHLLPLESTPGLLSLLAGKPNPTTFPFTSLNFTVRSPTDPSQDVALSLTGDELAVGLQYGATSGLERLDAWLFGLQEIAHKRMRSDGWKVNVGTGSQDLIFKVSPSFWIFLQYLIIY